GCVGRLGPAVRLVAVAGGGAGTLTVTAHYVDRTGAAHDDVLATLDAGDYAAWAPTPILPFLDPGARLADQIRGNVDLALSASGSAAWQVDDVSIDPWAWR